MIAAILVIMFGGMVAFLIAVLYLINTAPSDTEEAESDPT